MEVVSLERETSGSYLGTCTLRIRVYENSRISLKPITYTHLNLGKRDKHGESTTLQNYIKTLQK
jgi:hypothetical protein